MDRDSSQKPVHSQHTNTQTIKPSKSFKPRTHHTRFILMLATCDVYREIPRSQTRFRVATPRVNPGSERSEPVQPPHQTGVWTVADTQTQHIQSIQARRLRRYEELMIHRIRRATQPRRRGHHRAGGAGAVAVEAGAARAGEAEKPSEMGAPGVAEQRRGNVATSGRQQQRGLVGRRSQGPSGSSGRFWVQPMKLGLEEPVGWNCRCAWRGDSTPNFSNVRLSLLGYADVLQSIFSVIIHAECQKV